ncbi:MAG: hypothetical protein NTX03_09800 [Bacteroidetes bacterium]|nr:hypothetical protein [Bacteroidota bacterium]
MPLFKPYKIIETPNVLLHLKLSSFNKALQIFAFRLMPIFVIEMLLWLYFLIDKKMPLQIYAGLFLLFGIAMFILTKKIISGVVFRKDEIEISSYRILSSTSKTYLLNDISHIHMEVYNRGRGSGVFYRLVLKSGKKIRVLNLPIFFNFDKARYRNVNQKLTEITGLKIEGDLGQLEIS